MWEETNLSETADTPNCQVPGWCELFCSLFFSLTRNQSLEIELKTTFPVHIASFSMLSTT